MSTEKFKADVTELFKDMNKAKIPFVINIIDGENLICGMSGKPSKVLTMIVATIFNLADSIDEDASAVAADVLTAVLRKEIKEEEDEDDD